MENAGPAARPQSLCLQAATAAHGEIEYIGCLIYSFDGIGESERTLSWSYEMTSPYRASNQVDRVIAAAGSVRLRKRLLTGAKLITGNNQVCQASGLAA
jgi:hypothetical protein